MFNLFNKNPNKLSTIPFTVEIKDDDVILKDRYGHGFQVSADDIETVTLTSSGAGTQKLQLIGKGTVLAEMSLPGTYAQKFRKFIQERLAARKNGQA